MKKAIKTFGSFALTLVVLALLNSGCRRHLAHVYSGVDPKVRPAKSDPIVFELPDNPSIRERKMAVLIRDELLRNGFNLVEDYKISKWTMSFAVDRQTYTIGSTSRGSAVGLQFFGTPVTTGSSNTKYVQQTDVTVYMHLLKTEEIGTNKPMAIWEGSVRAKEGFTRDYPNSFIKNLISQFGENYEGNINMSSTYERSVRAAREGRPD